MSLALAERAVCSVVGAYMTPKIPKKRFSKYITEMQLEFGFFFDGSTNSVPLLVDFKVYIVQAVIRLSPE